MSESVWNDLLHELHGPMIRAQAERNVLLSMLAEDRARDEAWLASLTPLERRRELARRRRRRLRCRVENWLDDYVTFRFAKSRPEDCDGEW